MPTKEASIPSEFERYLVKQEGYNERGGIIQSEVTPTQLQTIKTAAAQGRIGPLYELYTKMEATDSRYGGLVGSLKSAIGGMPVKVIAAEGTTAGETAIARDYATLIEENLAVLDVPNLLKEFSDAFVRGAKVFEYKYGIHEYPNGRKVAFVDEIRSIPGFALAMDIEKDSPTWGELMIQTEQEPRGIAVSKFRTGKIHVLQSQMGKGFYDTFGAARKCLAWYIVKVYAQLWWAEFVEIYGQPLRIAKYPEGAGAKSKATMERFLQMLGKASYGLFPQGMELQLIEANKSGTVTTYQDIIKMANNEMAIALLGQTDTMGGSKEGSYAKTKVLDGIRYEILEDIARIAGAGFGQFVRAVIFANYGPDANPRLFPRVQPLVVDPQDGKTKVETFAMMQMNGIAVPLDHIYEQTGVPKPKIGEAVVIKGQILDFTDEAVRSATKPEEPQENAPVNTEE
jgi:phage gp29-like protein